MSTQDLSNLIINGRYLLLRKIGAGGMATVYEAVDRELDKRVAVKVLNPEWRSDEEQVGRFRQEARTAARVRHPHLVDVTDRGITDDGIPFLVMELLEGKSLAQEMFERPGPFPWRRAVDLGVQVCGALTAAHEAGLVHRDIKPGNCFLVERQGQSGDFLKLLDLGIAKIVHGPRDPHAPPSTRTNQAPGTPEYMAPEQTTGEGIGPGCDIYALGVMLFRMLTGSLPFVTAPGDPYWRILELHSRVPPPPLRTLAPEAGIPGSIEAIVLRCLAKRSEERWGSAAELATALRAAELQECPPPEVRVPETGVVTAVFQPFEPPRSLQRTLFHGLVGFQSLVLFMLVVMSLAIVDLPGVEAFADALRVEQPSSRSRRALQERNEESAEEAPRAVESARAQGGAAEEAPAGRSEGSSGSGEAQAAPESAVKEVVTPAPVRAPEKKERPKKPAPAVDPWGEEPSKPKAAEKPKESATTAGSGAKAPAQPEVFVQKFLDAKRSKFKHCRALFPLSLTYTVTLQLAPGTGQVIGVSLQPKRREEVDACVREVLLKLRIEAIKTGGVFPGRTLTL